MATFSESDLIKNIKTTVQNINYECDNCVYCFFNSFHIFLIRNKSVTCAALD